MATWPYTAVLPASDMRRHSVHQYYREWVKTLLLEEGISVFFVDIDAALCTPPSSLIGFPEDIVVEGHWPSDFRQGQYSFSFVTDGTWVMLNNGFALFSATPIMKKFNRDFMGLMASEVYLDYGFAQTGFNKILNSTHLQLNREEKHYLVGNNDYGLSVRSFNAPAFLEHPAGVVDWKDKKMSLEKANCWIVPSNWQDKWGNVSNVLDYARV